MLGLVLRRIARGKIWQKRSCTFPSMFSVFPPTTHLVKIKFLHSLLLPSEMCLIFKYCTHIHTFYMCTIFYVIYYCLVRQGIYLQENTRDFNCFTSAKYYALKLPLKMDCTVFANYFFMG